MLNKIVKIVFLALLTNSVLISQTYKIVETGQTKSYDSTKAITTPTAGQAFFGQNSNHTGNARSYTNNGNGTITDNVTGLMWQQTEDQNGDGVINFYDKLTYNEALDSASKCKTGGYNDWRLPTIKELYSLAMFYGAEPGPPPSNAIKYIDTTYFSVGTGDVNSLSHGSLGTERVIDGQIASSTKYISKAMGVIEAMFGFNFIDGRIKGYPTTFIVPECGTAKHFYILYVRGNSEYGTNQFVDNGNGTITDNATGLMWMQNDNGSGLTWENALSYAERTTYAGYSDWRLPDVKELQSIVDYTRAPSATASAAINPLFNCTSITNEGGEADFPWYWSNTTFSSQSQANGASAAYVCFGRALGYMSNFGGWVDIHGAGCQRSDPKPGSFAGYTKNGTGYYNANAPQGDAVRIYNYARLVRNASSTGINDSPKSSSNLGLEQNSPNPFKGNTLIRYNVVCSGNVSLKIYDVFGNEIATPLNNNQEQGDYSIIINSEKLNLNSGIYFYKFVNGNYSETKSMIVTQ